MNTIITTDSGMDPININTMIPGQIIENDLVCYKDVFEISSKKIIEKLNKEYNFKTSSPLPVDYYSMFEKYINKYNIIHLSMSSGISESSLNLSRLIADEFNEEYQNKIYVVDTMTGATGGTLINEIANNLIKKDISTENIVKQLNIIKKQIQTSFYVPNPQGFIRSGRNKSELCIKDKALLISSRVSNLTGIKYRVDFNNEGNLYIKQLFRCKNSVGMLKMIKSILNDETINQFDNNYVVIGNILEKDINMYEIYNYINSFNYFKNIINQEINGVVAAYASPDLCGISLLKKL